MLRIQFTHEDLLRTRVDRADPMWEMALSMHLLPVRCHQPAYHDWRRAARRRLPRLSPMLATLCPPSGDFADCLTPAAGRHGIAAGIDAVRSTPRHRLRRDLHALRQNRPLPGWTGALADGDRETVEALGTHLERYYHAVINPWWPHIQAHTDAERAALAQELVDGGVERLLANLRPWARWRYPVLEVDYPNTHTLDLRGRGLRLVPSFFCTGRPVTLIDPDLDPVLVFPAVPDLTTPGFPAASRHSTQRHLTALLGPTRAEVLSALTNGATTTQLGRQLDIAPSSASRHTAILRDAGLITSRRHGPTVIHLLTPLGAALLDGSLSD